ncbi:hypothetical protein V8E36_009493 [Tilletia maclaganii]
MSWAAEGKERDFGDIDALGMTLQSATNYDVATAQNYCQYNAHVCASLFMGRQVTVISANAAWHRLLGLSTSIGPGPRHTLPTWPTASSDHDKNKISDHDKGKGVTPPATSAHPVAAAPSIPARGQKISTSHLDHDDVANASASEDVPAFTDVVAMSLDAALLRSGGDLIDFLAADRRIFRVCVDETLLGGWRFTLVGVPLLPLSATVPRARKKQLARALLLDELGVVRVGAAIQHARQKSGRVSNKYRTWAKVQGIHGRRTGLPRVPYSKVQKG